MCVYFIIAGPLMHLNMHLRSRPQPVSPACTPCVASVLLFLTEFNEHIWSEDKRGLRDCAKRRRGEWGANGEGCEQAGDEDLWPSIITVPHEECQLLQTRADPIFADFWPLGPKPRRLLEPSGNLISRRASTHYYFNYQLVHFIPMQDCHLSLNALKQDTFMFKWRSLAGAWILTLVCQELRLK